MAIQSRDFERLMNQARIKLPGASDGGLKGELFDTLNEFVGDSNIWDEWIEVQIVPSIKEYLLTPIHGGMITRLVTMLDPNHIVLPASLPDFRPPSAALHLVWPQSNAMTAHALVVKNITLPNSKDEIPDAPEWLLPLYATKVLDGLLGRMMMQPNKSYSNDTQGTYHQKRFRDGIAVAKTAKARGNLLGGQSWRFPNQMRTNSQRGGVSTPFPQPSSWGV
jgi:hypothetical protein